MLSRLDSLPRLLAGLQVGILGGLVILGWFVVLSSWYFRTPWALVNLFSASIRDSATWSYAFARTTWTGMAAHLFACGVLGMFIGWVLPRPHAGLRISLAGLAFGVVLSLMVYEFFWRRYVPLLNTYVPAVAILIVHLLFGLSLAQFPRFYSRLADEPPPSAPEEPAQQSTPGA